MRLTGHKAAITIFILAFAVRLAFILLVPSHPLESDDQDYDSLGLSLSQGQGYVNSSGEPTAYRPPGYPLFLATIYWIAGHNLFWIRFLQAVLGAGSCVLIYMIAVILFNRTTARWSALLCCFYPPLIVWTSEIMSETLFLFFLLLGVWILVSGDSSARLWLSGIIFGASLLTRSNIIFFFPLLLYWIYSCRKTGFLKAMALFISAVLLICLPWTIRNYYRLHAFIPLVSMGGRALYVSYVVPDQGFGFASLKGMDEEYYKIKNEAEQSSYLMKKTVDYIMKNPPIVIKLTVLKVLHFIYPFDGYWNALSLGSKYNIFWGLVFCFSLVGLWHHRRDGDIHMRLLYLLFLSFILSIIVFEGTPRYRLPLEPFLICFAASGMMHLLRKKRRVFSLLVVTNLLFFVAFRFFNLQPVFDYLKKLM